jgi:hypothetical protein
MARHYQFTITGVLEAEDEEDARCELDELMGEVRGYLESELSEEIISQIRADLAVMPRAFSKTLDAEPEPTHDNAGYHGFEESGVTHPWDQGLWFFPEGHPLAPLERKAYEDTKHPMLKPKVRQQIRDEWVQKAITEGDPTAPEITEGDDA